MTPRFVARLFVSLALLAPIAVNGQTFIPKTPPDTASKLSITVNPVLVGPARLKYAGGNQTFEAQGETVDMTYEAAGLSVVMSEGSYASTTTQEPWQSRRKDTFKRLFLTFAPNGNMISFRISND